MGEKIWKLSFSEFSGGLSFETLAGAGGIRCDIAKHAAETSKSLENYSVNQNKKSGRTASFARSNPGAAARDLALA
jgi:hypothetical protein